MQINISKSHLIKGGLLIGVLAVLLGIVVYENIGGVNDMLPVVPDTFQSMPQPAPQDWQQPLPVEPPASPNSALQVQEGISLAVSMVRPSVVAIYTPDLDPHAGPAGLAYIKPYTDGGRAMGSGTIVHPQGYILTTFQAIGKAKTVRVRLFSGSRRDYDADVVGVDPQTDLALLKIRAPGPFPVAALGNSSFTETGDIVFAIGSPYGFSRSATMGIISTGHRQLVIDGINYPNLIQTDAAINEGDDGGPLINVMGEVIGINMAYYIPGKHFSGIGFAVPVNEAKNFLNTFFAM